MDIKLFDSERKVMERLWREGDTPAKDAAKVPEALAAVPELLKAMLK